MLTVVWFQKVSTNAMLAFFDTDISKDVSLILVIKWKTKKYNHVWVEYQPFHISVLVEYQPFHISVLVEYQPFHISVLVENQPFHIATNENILLLDEYS